MQVLHLVQRRLIPVGGGGVRPFLQGGEGGARHQRALAVEHGDGDQLVPVLLVQQLHPLVQALGGKVGVFDDAVIHGVAHPHHPAQVAVHVHVHLAQHPLGVLPHQLLGARGVAPDKAQAHEHHARHRGHGEGQGDDHLDAHGAVAPREGRRRPGEEFFHAMLTPLPKTAAFRSGPPGTWRGSRRSGA